MQREIPGVAARMKRKTMSRQSCKPVQLCLRNPIRDSLRLRRRRHRPYNASCHNLEHFPLYLEHLRSECQTATISDKACISHLRPMIDLAREVLLKLSSPPHRIGRTYGMRVSLPITAWRRTSLENLSSLRNIPPSLPRHSHRMVCFKLGFKIRRTDRRRSRRRWRGRWEAR